MGWLFIMYSSTIVPHEFFKISSLDQGLYFFLEIKTIFCIVAMISIVSDIFAFIPSIGHCLDVFSFCSKSKFLIYISTCSLGKLSSVYLGNLLCRILGPLFSCLLLFLCFQFFPPSFSSFLLLFVSLSHPPPPFHIS